MRYCYILQLKPDQMQYYVYSMTCVQKQILYHLLPLYYFYAMLYLYSNHSINIKRATLSGMFKERYEFALRNF